MCVIVVKPEGVQIKKSDLKKMWDHNSDGAGLAIYDKDKIRIIKGFMAFNPFWDCLNSLQDQQVVFHLRFATHGVTNQAQTHPFSVSSKMKTAKALRENTLYERILFHNGIISNFGNDKYSDTLDFCRNVLAKIPEESRIGLLSEISSKFVYMDVNEITMIGDFEKFKGLKVSNSYWDHGSKFFYQSKKQKPYDYKLWKFEGSDDVDPIDATESDVQNTINYDAELDNLWDLVSDDPALVSQFLDHYHADLYDEKE